MTQQLANKAAIESVEDMRRGLHLAMNELIRNKDYRRAEEILHQLDSAICNWIDVTKVAR